MYNNVTFGSDAEMFIRLNNKERTFFPVCGLVGGTKDEPKALNEPGFFVQEDNCAVEFNIPVCKTLEDWQKAFRKAINKVSALFPPTMDIVAEATANFDLELLDVPQAKVFGCEPDFNAWENSVNPRPVPPEPSLRTAAAHVHIGWENPKGDEREDLIRACDVFVSLPYLHVSPGGKRRQMYGKAGAFRPKDYGVEHRVQDNQWIEDEIQREQLFVNYNYAIDFLNKGGKIDMADKDAIQEAINTDNTLLGDKLHSKYWKAYLKLIRG